MNQEQNQGNTDRAKSTMNRRILHLAIPNIISNITIPLLSLVDTALAGRMQQTEAIGAVGLAASVLNFSFWIWAFLRMATTGFTAQAFGRSDVRTICRQLAVGTLLALIGGAVLVLLGTQSFWTALWFGKSGEVTADLAIAYYAVGILGAPAALLLYVYNGWFVGMQNTRVPMLITILTNIINISLSIFFVRVGGMGVRGLALGTVVAQYVGVLSFLLIALYRYRRLLRFTLWSDFRHLKVLRSYLDIGKYLLIRTASLGGVTIFFVKAGSSWGMITLGANTLLLQLFTTFSYFMDGFAYAGEALTGRYIGECKTGELGLMLRSLFGIGLLTASLISLLYLFFPSYILELLSNKEEILAHALEHRYWVIAIPLVSFVAFLWDGIFVGATDSKSMSIVMLVATMVFFTTYYLFRGVLLEDTLWLAFLSYLTSRSAVQSYIGVRVLLPRLGLGERIR